MLSVDELSYQGQTLIYMSYFLSFISAIFFFSLVLYNYTVVEIYFVSEGVFIYVV